KRAVITEVRLTQFFRAEQPVDRGPEFPRDAVKHANQPNRTRHPPGQDDGFKRLPKRGEENEEARDGDQKFHPHSGVSQHNIRCWSRVEISVGRKNGWEKEWISSAGPGTPPGVRASPGGRRSRGRRFRRTWRDGPWRARFPALWVHCDSRSSASPAPRRRCEDRGRSRGAAPHHA